MPSVLSVVKVLRRAEAMPTHAVDRTDALLEILDHFFSDNFDRHSFLDLVGCKRIGRVVG